MNPDDLICQYDSAWGVDDLENLTEGLDKAQADMMRLFAVTQSMLFDHALMIQKINEPLKLIDFEMLKEQQINLIRAAGVSEKRVLSIESLLEFKAKGLAQARDRVSQIIHILGEEGLSEQEIIVKAKDILLKELQEDKGNFDP